MVAAILPSVLLGQCDLAARALRALVLKAQLREAA
jgi:hypothetical protein